jgi:hypothetical protein
MFELEKVLDKQANGTYIGDLQLTSGTGENILLISGK